MRTRLLFCAVIGLVCFIGAPAFAQFTAPAIVPSKELLALQARINQAQTDDDAVKTNRCLARPCVVTYDNDYEYDNLSEFWGSFAVVEATEKDSVPHDKKFEIVNPKHRDVWIWEVEYSFVPSEARITQQTDNYLRKAGKARTSREYEIWLASFWVNFSYSGPALKSVSDGQITARPIVSSFVRIKTDNLGTSTALNDDQLELLINSIKTQRPVRLKGKMYINFSASNVTELQGKLENEGVIFTVLEINGQPVPKSY